MIIQTEYFNWLLNLIEDTESPKVANYMQLLGALYGTEFDPRIAMDSNRALDGVNLRFRFCNEFGYGKETADLYLIGQCKVLEMMVALACRCECEITGNNYAGKWFWVMVDSLGLSEMTDDKYDDFEVTRVLIRFMSGQYQRNGKGSLFTVPNPPKDMRKTELWYQMCYYLDNVYT